MNYMKPQIATLGPAIIAIQGNGKGQHNQDNVSPRPFNATVGAYDADE